MKVRWIVVLALTLTSGAHADEPPRADRSASDEASPCPAPWQGLEVVRDETRLVLPNEPTSVAIASIAAVPHPHESPEPREPPDRRSRATEDDRESACVGVVVVPARAEVAVQARLISGTGRTWHEGWTTPLVFVRGCGDDPHVVLRAAESVVVRLVVVRDPPPELADATCRASRPGVESRPPSLGPEPPFEPPAPPPLDPPWTSAAELAVEGDRRVDLGTREGCVRVDVVGAVHGGRVRIAAQTFALWAAPWGAWAAVCASGATVLELEGEGPLAVRVSRAAGSRSGVGGAEATGLRRVARGAAEEGLPVQVHLRARERLRRAASGAGCRRWVAVAADEAPDARFELRLIGPSEELVARGRGGPGRAARVDTCAEVAAWELVQLGASGRIVVEEASW